MNATFSAKRMNILIVLVSSLMMIAVLNLPFKAKPFGDDTFHVEAKNMARYLKGALSYDKVTITKAPGPIIFYTPAYLIAPSDATDNQLWIYATVFTFLIVTISLLLIFRIGARLFSKEVGLLSILLFFIFPIHCYYSLGILAEVPAFFSLTLALYGWSLLSVNPDKKMGWILMVLGIWFLILNRPNVTLLLGLGFLVIAYSFFKKKEFFKKYGKKLALSLLVVGLMSVGSLRLAKIVNGENNESSQEALFYSVALQGRFQFREEPTDFRFWDDDNRADSKDYQSWVKKIGELDAIEDKSHRTSKEVQREFLFNDVLEHPFLFTRQFFVKCFYGQVYFINSVRPKDFHLGPIHGAMGYWLVILTINTVNILLIFGGFLFLFKEKKLIDYWLFWGVMVSLLVFHGLTYMEPRYMFPSRVGLYLMSAAGLYQIKWVRRKVDFIANYIFKVKNQ